MKPTTHGKKIPRGSRIGISRGINTSDRSFDNANRFNQDEKINLLAKGKIVPTATDRSDNVHPAIANRARRQ